MEATEVQRNVQQVLNMVERRGVKVIVTMNGKPTCAIEPVSDAELAHQQLVRTISRRADRTSRR